LTDSARQVLTVLQQGGDALRASRTEAEAKNVYIQKMLPPPGNEPPGQIAGKVAAAIVQRSTDAQQKLAALGSDPLTILQKTVADAGDAASADVRAAADSAAKAWSAMQTSLQALAVDADRARKAAASADQDDASAKASADAIASIEDQSKTSAQDFDTAIGDFVGAQASILSQTAKG
jgi:hypothetical protein